VSKHNIVHSTFTFRF